MAPCFQAGCLEFKSEVIKVYLPKWRISSIVKCALLYLLSTAFIHCLAVLYGAPLIESASETFHFSWLLATAAVLPACSLLGTHSDSWLRVFARNSPQIGVESSLYLTTICSIIGAWLGAFPIPLDWDRTWQVWPRSCVIGTLLGYCVGLLLSAVQLIRRHRTLLKPKLT
ncbi:Phosphatidylinositol-glycan biosynthesis class F protein [Lamellibrachia satsuma]|nr:Phosphatidylinositol-glycan biosynthesis class F protein [Lamellibrachia satsuma]